MSVKKLILQSTGFITLIVLWQVTSMLHASPALPPPHKVIQTLWELIHTGILTEHIIASLEIILLGITIAVFFGLSMGILMSGCGWFKTAVLPLLESVRGIAALTLFPLLIVLFGIGTFSRVFIIFWTAWPAIVLAAVHSLQTEESIINAAKDCGAGKWQIMLYIRLPLALPGILNGIRIGVGGGWIGLVAAEMLGAARGLGYFLLWSAQSFQFERVYATIIIISATGGSMNFGLALIQKKLNKIFGG